MTARAGGRRKEKGHRVDDRVLWMDSTENYVLDNSQNIINCIRYGS